ncbi:MAG: glycosyltransferase family 1 protein [Salegentibacter sp.]
MRIIIFTHPGFIGSQSMPRYAKLLSEGMRKRGHMVEVWTPQRFFHRIPFPKAWNKWLGYLDQFIVFPMKVRSQMKKCSPNTLFVFADQALGPWVPLVHKRPHVVHCHDFLAQRSALGELRENKVGYTGRLYQKMIRRGYRKAENFISISRKTQQDLHRFLSSSPKVSEVVYNGLNQDFKPQNMLKARRKLEEEFKLNLKEGYILHVGGNQFYKNRNGVIEIYNTWRNKTKTELPLVMIGPQPSARLQKCRDQSPFSSSIHLLSAVSDEALKLAYQGATVFLFPSLEEGFGWPIAEAMASGCPVITTNSAPMNEVGGESCRYIPRLNGDKKRWAEECEKVLEEVVSLTRKEREKLASSGVENARRFEPEKALSDIDSIYRKILNNYQL